MQTSGSERVRMQAAERLCEIQMLREQREIAELRAAARAESSTSLPAPAETPADERQAPAPATESATEAAQRFIKSMEAN